MNIQPTNSALVSPYLPEVRQADTGISSEVAKGGFFNSDPFAGGSMSLSQRNSLLGRVQNNFSVLGEIVNALTARRNLDVSEGLGLFEGASCFGSQTAGKYSLHGQESPRGSSFVESILTLFAGDADPSPSNSLFRSAFPSLPEWISNLFSHSEQGAELAGVQTSGGAPSPLSAPFATPFGGGSAAGGIQAAGTFYQLFDNWGQMDPKLSAVSGAASGAYIGSTIMPGVGTVVGAVIGGVVGAVGGLMKTGKHDDQLARDQVRAIFQQRGWIDSSFSLTLTDGSKYDIGKDGGHQLANSDGSTRRAYEIDVTNPLSHEVIGMIQPIVSALCGGDLKLTADFTGYLTNAALSNASSLDEAKKNIRGFVEQFQIDPDTVMAGTATMVDQGILSNEVGAAYLNGIRSLYL